MKQEGKKVRYIMSMQERTLWYADGSTIYQNGALVKEGLTTGEDGSATLDNLNIGTYVVTETQAPDKLVCTGESQTVTLSSLPVKMKKFLLARLPLPTTDKKPPYLW